MRPKNFHGAVVEKGLVRVNDKPGIGLDLLPDFAKRKDVVIRRLDKTTI